MQNFTLAPVAASDISINYRSTYVDWEIKFLNVGSDGLLTNTPYDVMLSAKSHSNPTFLPVDPQNPGCVSQVPLFQIKPEEMLRDVIWQHFSFVSFEAQGRNLEIISNPAFPRRAPVVYSLIETWVDENGNNYVNGARGDEEDEYFEGVRANIEGGITRSNLQVIFDRAGEHLVKLEISVNQYSYPEDWPSSTCRLGKSFFEVIEPVEIRILLGVVRDKAQVEAEANAKAKAKAEAETKAKSKRSTIICVKGKSTLKVSGKKPKCPSGYKKK